MSEHKIDFSSIPEDIQIQIVQKQDFYTFAQFSKSSREANNITKKIRGRITFPVYEWTINENNGDVVISNDSAIPYILTKEIATKIPIRIEGKWVGWLSPMLTNKFCEMFVEFCLKTNSTTEAIYTKRVRCSFDSFFRLMEVAKIRKVYSLSLCDIYRHYLYEPAIKSLGKLVFLMVLNDSAFLNFKLPSMKATDCSASNEAINQFLKEWLNGKRDITDIEIEHDVREDHSFDGIFNGIEYSCGETTDAHTKVYTVKKDENHVITLTTTIEIIEREYNLGGKLYTETTHQAHIHMFGV